MWIDRRQYAEQTEPTQGSVVLMLLAVAGSGAAGRPGRIRGAHHSDEGLVDMTAVTVPFAPLVDLFVSSTRTPVAPVAGSLLELVLS